MIFSEYFQDFTNTYIREEFKSSIFNLIQNARRKVFFSSKAMFLSHWSFTVFCSKRVPTDPTKPKISLRKLSAS